MRISTTFITFNRLECTKQTIASYLETVTVPYTAIVVDNGSTDGTQEWLENELPEGGEGEDAMWWKLLLPENKYPGYACNKGWHWGCTNLGIRWGAIEPPDFLHRADNDWTFLPGWCDTVAEAFENPLVGQVGLRTDREESDRNGKPIPWNVGGNNIIRRQLWDAGLRYDERPWTELPAGHSEDTYLSPAVAAMGYEWQRVAKPCIVGNSVESRKDPYYVASYRARRIYGFK
jgi:glycosyltransferase involved in cell wall biosynthesis